MSLSQWSQLLGLAQPRQPTERPFNLPGDTPHYPRDRTVDFLHTRIEVALDFENAALAGRVVHTVEPIIDGVTAVELDAVEMTIESVAVEGARAEHAQDDDKIRVRLPRARSTGETFSIEVVYRCRPRRGLYFVRPDAAYPDKPLIAWTQGQDVDSRYWFPCFDVTHDRATTELLATVPAHMTAVGNGALVEVTEDAERGTKTYHWRESVAHAPYLTTLVAGELSEIREDVDGIPVVYYCVPGREEDTRRAFGKTPAMMRFFRERIGIEYPYEKYAQVAVPDFIFGGMENASATTQTDRVLHDERAHLDFDGGDFLAAHELAHQWFGDLWTCRDWSHGWLNEGFATFFETLFTEHDRGWDDYAYELLQNTQAYLDEDSGRYRRPIVTNVWSGPIDIFDRHLYEKGGLVLHMLRWVLGEDLFWKAIRHYAAVSAGKNVLTADLQRAITEATGRNVDWFFDQYVYGGGHPEFKVSWEWDEDASLARVKVEQTQKLDELTGLFRTPVEIALHTSAAEHRFRVEVSENEHVFSFRLNERPAMVRFDPGNWLLKTLDFKKATKEEVHQLTHDPDPIGRVRAARSLGRKGSAEAVAALRTALLADRFWGVQAEAAKALGQARSAAALDALIEGLAAVAHPKARRRIVEAIGEFREDRAAQALIPVADGDASYFVEAAAAKALGKTHSTLAFDAMVRQLGKESFAQVIRAGVFEGFAGLKDDRALPILEDWTRYGRPNQAREAAVGALGKLAEGKPDVIDHLVDLLDDPWFVVRLRAVAALQDARDRKAIPALRRLETRDLDGRVRRRCREAIASLSAAKGQVEEVKHLTDEVEKLHDANKELRDRLEKLEARLSPEAR